MSPNLWALTANSWLVASLTWTIFRADFDKQSSALPKAVQLDRIHCRRGSNGGKETVKVSKIFVIQCNDHYICWLHISLGLVLTGKKLENFGKRHSIVLARWEACYYLKSSFIQLPSFPSLDINCTTKGSWQNDLHCQLVMQPKWKRNPLCVLLQFIHTSLAKSLR